VRNLFSKSALIVLPFTVFPNVYQIHIIALFLFFKSRFYKWSWTFLWRYFIYVLKLNFLFW